MIYTDMTKLALRICFDAHIGQTDKGGVPYVYHPLHLAEQMNDEHTIIVALLHDVVEDTHYSLEDLESLGFDRQVLDALALLTHDNGTPYMEYIAAIRDNPIARTVKLADLKHNCDLTRLDAIKPKDRKLVRKYRIAQAILEDDRYDHSCRHYVKHLPLDDIGMYYLTVYYTETGIVQYSFDIEDAADTHYRFGAESCMAIRDALHSTVSLPEALSEYMLGRGEAELVELLTNSGVSYERFCFG